MNIDFPVHAARQSLPDVPCRDYQAGISRVELCCAHMLRAGVARFLRPGHPLSIKHLGGCAHTYVSSSPLIKPDIGFSPVRLSDDLLPCAYQHPLSMKYTITRTGTSPAWRATRHEVSCNSSYHRCTSALGILEVGPKRSSSRPRCVCVEGQLPCGSCASRAGPG